MIKYLLLAKESLPKQDTPSYHLRNILKDFFVNVVGIGTQHPLWTMQTVALCDIIESHLWWLLAFMAART